ncbi:hypothetical protein IIA95_02625 [Patescibacteria group bacterium]|nr:hypothetical protein [Patescibacteria group bacterium]
MFTIWWIFPGLFIAIGISLIIYTRVIERREPTFITGPPLMIPNFGAAFKIVLLWLLGIGSILIGLAFIAGHYI